MKLLVSVQNADEVTAALQGGADILDVKQPAAGPLGMATTETLQLIAQRARELNPAIPLSAALGELRDWCTTTAAIPNLIPPEVCYLKTGLSETAGWDGWEQRWLDLAGQLQPCRNWVTVAYADSQRSHSPDPLVLVEAAIRARSPVFLIDTWQKDSTCLLDWCSADLLQLIRRKTAAAGIQLALAGQLRANHLAEIAQSAPDIIAVRGAVCEAGSRSAQICAERVRELSDRLLVLQQQCPS